MDVKELAWTEFSASHPELVRSIFGLLDGKSLTRAREVCQKWNAIASEDQFCKDLCVQKWKSLETDEHAAALVLRGISPVDHPTLWRHIYP